MSAVFAPDGASVVTASEDETALFGAPTPTAWMNETVLVSNTSVAYDTAWMDEVAVNNTISAADSTAGMDEVAFSVYNNTTIEHFLRLLLKDSVDFVRRWTYMHDCLHLCFYFCLRYLLNNYL